MAHKLFLFLFLIPGLSSAQTNLNDSYEIIYYGKDTFLLEGTIVHDSLKENTFDRLPLSYKSIVRPPVWELSKNSAGMSIRFLTNSSSISIKWEVLNNFTMNHMAESGIKGVDLYFKNKGAWQYLSTGLPTGFQNESTVISNMDSEMREFKIFLPLYDGVVNIEVGIDPGSIIKKGLKNKKKEIIFYGTSITQGGCASRPGMAHTNIMSRRLDRDVVNFGFSGNGRMETPIAQIISESDPLLYVIECLPNMFPPESVTDKTIPLIDTIRKNNADAPIVLVDLFGSTASVLDKEGEKSAKKINSDLRTEYEKMINLGYSNIFYIDSKNATGIDNEGTVDGVHFTDLGFIRYADFLIDKLGRLGLINN